MESLANPPAPDQLLDAALDGARRGWHVFPLHTFYDGCCTCDDKACDNPAKHPLTPHGLLDATRDETTINRWWSEATIANVGLRTGEVSGLWVLDCDGPAGIAAIEALEKKHGPLPTTLTVNTGGGGRHYYFAWPDDGSIGNRTKLHELPIDVRGDGGYVIVPPSLHRSARCYSWSISPAQQPLAQAPAWLVALVRENGEATTPEIETVVEPSVEITGTTTTIGNAAHKMVVQGGADVSARARAYLAKTPPAISGQEGHNQTYKAACALVLGFRLTPDAAYPLLAEWNATCQPPWKERDLRRKLREADKQTGERGYLLHDSSSGPSSGPSIVLPTTTSATTTIRLGATTTPAAPVASPVAAYRPFPVEVLPEPVKSYVVEGAAALGCDPAFVALPALGAMAGAIGNARAVRLKSTWTEPAILWVVVVADSGSLKSPAQELPVKRIYDAQRTMRRDYNERLAEHQQELLRHEVDLVNWKKKPTDKPPQKPEPPICRRVVVADSTIEALAQLLHENPRGLLLVRDELAGWVGGFNAYKSRGGNDAAQWLELHRAGELTVDRKTGQPRSISVSRAAVSVVGGIQPRTLARVLTRDYFESGLAARLLVAMPPRAAKEWTEAELSATTRHRFEQLVEGLLELEPEIDDHGDVRPIVLPLESKALPIWRRFYNAHNREQAALTSDLAAAWSKLEGYVPRLALVLHLARVVGGDNTADGKAIDAASLTAAIKLVDWFKHEAERVYAMLHETDGQRDGRELVERIRAKGGSITARQLQLSSRRYGNVEVARAALDALAQAGLGRWVEQPAGERGGRPTQVLVLHDDQAPTLTEPPADDPPDGGCVGCVDVGAEVEAAGEPGVEVLKL
jgi:hypothetical protein